MKNLKVSAKLLIGFGIATVLTVIVGIVGTIGILQTSGMTQQMYANNLQPISKISVVKETLQIMRVNVREMVIASIDGNQVHVTNSFAIIESLVPVMAENLTLIREEMTDLEDIRIFEEARALYENDLIPVVLGIAEAARVENLPAMLTGLEECRRLARIIELNFAHNQQIMLDQAQDYFDITASLSTNLLIMIIAVIVAAMAIAITLALYISRLISKPLPDFIDFMSRAGSTGDISISEANLKNIQQYSQVKDEIGQLINSAASFIGHVSNISKELNVLASGNLASEFKPLSDKDTMGNSIKTVFDNLNGMFGEVKVATAQVAVASKQIADGSQSLAQGSTEQAASVQELSSSIQEIAKKTKSNANMAERAAMLARDIKLSAQKGSQQMAEMMVAVKEINLSSQNISKVIRSIDDIAFQTNILALNAAVEAARAGQHGKGFAVVAEEVRNLAAKSAESAKDTEKLIADSIEKAELGSRIADETAASLAEIVAGIGESNQLVSEIAQSSEEQSAGISQINIGIDQVTQVTQQNSATAEQSAAASQEMSSQSQMLEELILRFKLKI